MVGVAVGASEGLIDGGAERKNVGLNEGVMVGRVG